MARVFANVEQFTRGLQKWATKTVPASAIRTHQLLCLEVYSRVIDLTPVDTGALKGSWEFTISSPAREVIPEETAEARQHTVQNEMTNGVAKIPAFAACFLSNNRDYAIVIEEGGFVPPNPGPSKDPRKGRFGRVLVQGGYSIQAPKGMVSVVVNQFRLALGL